MSAYHPTCDELKHVGGPYCDKHLVMNPDCTLTWWFWALQPALLLVVCLAVLVKRRMRVWNGRPTERRIVWALDAAKQAASAATLQIGAGLGAQHLHNATEDSRNATDECAWFAVLYLVNATMGVFIAYALLFHVCKQRSSGRYSTKTTGVSYRTWGKQFVLWILVSASARGVIHLLLWSNLSSTDQSVLTFVATLAQAFGCRPDGFEVTVFVCCSLILNIFMACVQDSILMDKRPPARPLTSLTDSSEDGIGTGLLHASSMARAAPAVWGWYNAVEEPDEDTYEVIKSQTGKSYKAKRKACIKGCCGCIVLSILVVMWTGVLFKVHSGQQVFDPCYVQVRAEYPEDYRTPDTTHPNCTVSEPIKDPKTGRSQSFKYMIEHRQDLVNKTAGDGQWKPMCKCCNAKTPSNLSEPCTLRSGATGAMDCPGLGECCARSTLHDPMPDLMRDCSICMHYKPCDQQRCPARPDNIRNSQHFPMLLGVLVSFVGNCQVIFSFSFNKALQQRNITALLAWAAAVELVYCLCFMLQELAFRIPEDVCILGEDAKTTMDGQLDYSDCPTLSQYTGWPTWAQVESARRLSTLHGGVDGDRGSAINNCAAMSVLFQLTWTATDSFFFMITIDLLLNLLTSPFGSTRKRFFFYHGWTWAVSIFLAVSLYISGDWGVSFDSILEDFCWHRNFGRANETSAPNSNEYLTGNGILNGNLVYGLSFLYNLVALLVSLYSYLKLRTLTPGQREVREGSIKEGIMVTLACALWWVVLFGIVYRLVLRQSPAIVAATRMQAAPTDYALGDRVWVVMWAFVVGARNAITPLVWQLVVWQVHRVGAENADDPNTKELTEILQNELLFFTGLGIRAAVRDASPGGHNRDSVSADAPDMSIHVDLHQAGLFEQTHETAFFRSFQPVFLKGHDESTLGFPAALTRQMQQFKFKSYRPRTFAALRRLFDTNAGVESLRSSAGGGDDRYGLLHAAMEHYESGNFSGGASGAFMYFSADKRYIVKQMSEEEKNVLLKMLDAYFDYMSKNSDSLLLRVVQCNQVQMYQGCSSVPVLGKCLRGRLYFMVFQNLNFDVLQETMDEIRQLSSLSDQQASAEGEEREMESELRLRARASAVLKESMLQYDLKGSWVNRTTIKRGPPAQTGAVGTLKDGDLHEQLYLPKDERNALIEQLSKDTQFLSIKKRLMPLTHTAHRRTGSPTYFPNQGKAAASYHIGIIDILQEWNTTKKMERWAKLLLGKDIDGLSAIDAESFRTRFMEAMENHFPALDVDFEVETEDDEDVQSSESGVVAVGGDSPGATGSFARRRRMDSRPRLSSGNLRSDLRLSLGSPTL